MEKLLAKYKSDINFYKKRAGDLEKENEIYYEALERKDEKIEDLQEIIDSADEKICLKTFKNWYKQEEWDSFDEAYEYYINNIK